MQARRQQRVFSDKTASSNMIFLFLNGSFCFFVWVTFYIAALREDGKRSFGSQTPFATCSFLEKLSPRHGSGGRNWGKPWWAQPISNSTSSVFSYLWILMPTSLCSKSTTNPCLNQAYPTPISRTFDTSANPMHTLPNIKTQPTQTWAKGKTKHCSECKLASMSVKQLGQRIPRPLIPSPRISDTGGGARNVPPELKCG